MSVIATNNKKLCKSQLFKERQKTLGASVQPMTIFSCTWQIFLGCSCSHNSRPLLPWFDRNQPSFMFSTQEPIFLENFAAKVCN